MAFRSSSAISENSIVFFEGGHDHDGVSSSLIDTEQYSIYDFIVGKTGSNARQIRQQRNFDNLKTVVSNIVINDVLGPSGVRLLPNSVQSIHIAAGAITANELAANVILVNNVIKSNNYSAGVSGWAISGNGTAEFDAASIRGTLTAAAVSTPGVDIYANGVLAASNFTIYANGAIANNNFSVDASGNLTATNANITGQINATSGSISGDLIAGGTISGTSININSGTFQVSSSGALTASSASITGTVSSSNLTATGGSIGGWQINSGSLGTGLTILDPGGNISIGGALNASGNLNTGGQVTASQSIITNTTVQANGVLAGYFPNGYVDAQYYYLNSGVTGTGTGIVVNANNRLVRSSSLRELKDNIEPFSGALDIINSLSPVTFNWKPQEWDEDDIHTNNIHLVHKVKGFIVEDVMAVGEDLVHYKIDRQTDEITGEETESLKPTMWKTDDFIAIAIQGIKELKEVVSGLQTTVSALEQRIQQLENGV